MSEDRAPEADLVPGYAGHADALSRRLSDQQVRAWVGELLVDLRDRGDVDGYGERVDALLMRCEFADQHVIHAIEDDRFAQPAYAAAIEGCDRKLVAAANAVPSTKAGELAGLLDALEHAFDERAAAIATRLKR